MHATSTTTAHAQSSPRGLPASRGAAVLLADGDHDVHALYSALLEHRGHAVIHARSVAQCLRLVRSHPVSAVVVSVGPCGLFGWRAYHRLARTARGSGFALICLTTDPHLTTDPRRHRRCAFAVLMLPCTPDTLAAEVERAIAETRRLPN